MPDTFANPDRDQVLRLAASAGLPTADLEAVNLAHFLACGDPLHPDGVVGLELHGVVALLRSLAVEEGSRGAGKGKALVAAAEAHARSRGVRELYLLTTTAEAFFRRLGYSPADRAGAPQAIRDTAEFSSLCPSSAAFLMKRLQATGLPEPWLRGPVAGVPPLLQPAAHAFMLSLEDAERAAAGLSDADLWIRPGGAASAGYHLLHLSGSTDRLLTYARGAALSPEQLAALAAEKDTHPARTLADLMEAWRETVRRALEQLAETPQGVLDETRAVGRAGLPATVLGLLFHAAEHSQRHAGQLATTVKVLHGMSGNPHDS